MAVSRTKLSAEEIVELSREYTFFSWSIQGETHPIPVARAEGVYFWDARGKRYLDFASQLVNANVGHQNPRVIKAIQEQAAELAFVAPGMTTEPQGALGQEAGGDRARRLEEDLLCPGWCRGRTRMPSRSPGSTRAGNKILARYRSYHGATHGAIALTGDYRRLPVEPAMPGVVHVLDPYCYRCPFGWTRDTCHRECIAHVEEIIQHEGPDQIAAIILEGVTGTNGLIIPPDEYWPRMREICDKYGILLISDEVMSGWGRTGTWFAVDNWNVVPDIITTAKGLDVGLCAAGGRDRQREDRPVLR